MQWHGAEKPSAASIAGAGIAAQGLMHILSVTTTGGAILGSRPLEADGVEPLLAYSQGMICRGLDPVRKWTPDDGQRIPSLATWGYDVIQIRANMLFGSQRPRSGV